MAARYLTRVVDAELDELLPALSAVALDGAKGGRFLLTGSATPAGSGTHSGRSGRPRASFLPRSSFHENARPDEKLPRVRGGGCVRPSGRLCAVAKWGYDRGGEVALVRVDGGAEKDSEAQGENADVCTADFEEEPVFGLAPEVVGAGGGLPILAEEVAPVVFLEPVGR